MLRRIAAAACIAFLCAPAVAQGATKSQAQRAAREAASSYAKQRYAIGGPLSDWRASCTRRPNRLWRCRVTGPCEGTVVLRERSRNRLSKSSLRIHCGD